MIRAPFFSFLSGSTCTPWHWYSDTSRYRHFLVQRTILLEDDRERRSGWPCRHDWVPSPVTGKAGGQGLSPSNVAHLSQNVFLPLLLKEALSSAADLCPSSQVRSFDASTDVHEVHVSVGLIGEAMSPQAWMLLGSRKARLDSTKGLGMSASGLSLYA